MFSYLIRRVLLGIVTLVLITFVVYGLIRNMPGSPLDTDPRMTDPSRMPNPVDIERMERLYGLDKPWYTAYFTWMRNMVVDRDMGQSFVHHEPVVTVIGEKFYPTLKLSVSSLTLTYLLSIPLGLYSTARSGRTDERIFTTVLYMLYSFPTFVAALFLQLLFAIKLAGTPLELPLFGMTSDGHAQMNALQQALDELRHMLLPVTCYTYGSLAYLSRFIKSNMEEAIRQDYIRTARAKGLGPFRVYVFHAFRNTLIPFITLMGLSLPALLSGSIILEQIFSWPGMGRLFFESIGRRDYGVIMGLTLLFSVLTLLGQLLADMLYAFLDPRITFK